MLLIFSSFKFYLLNFVLSVITALLYELHRFHLLMSNFDSIHILNTIAIMVSCHHQLLEKYDQNWITG
jgi:cytochrome b subunit of formate dehydrogenase